MQKNRKFQNNKQQRHQSKGKVDIKRKTNHSSANSLLQKIANNLPIDKENQSSGKIVITKLNDFVQDKCHYGPNCAHLRAQAKCEYLHEKKDYQALSITLPEKYLQNEEPLKKSKKQRKQDKIIQKAQRQKRLQEKLNRQDKQKQEQKIFQEQKVIQQKQLDPKQLLIQQILKTQKSYLSLQHIYEQLNLITDAYTLKDHNIYSQKFDLYKIKITMFEIRKRLLVKLKKNKQYEAIHRKFIQKQQSFVKKLIKNILLEYQDQIEQIKSAEKGQSLDLRQIYQVMQIQKINKVLRSKKQSQSIIEYYSRFFNSNYGYPISFQIGQEEVEEIQVQKGNLLTLKEFYLLTLLAPNYQFERVFVALNISFAQLRAISQFSSLLIAHRVQQKQPVQKALTIDIMNTSYSKFVQQIMTEYLSDYHQKLKPAGEFVFGKIDQNLKKLRAFLSKYKTKIQSQNKLNSFILIVYNIKDLLKRIQELNLNENLGYDSIKKDRTSDQESTYEKVFLLNEFIKISGEGSADKLKVVYVNHGKKLKLKKYKNILEKIDEGLKDKEKTEEKIQEEAP